MYFLTFLYHHFFLGILIPCRSKKVITVFLSLSHHSDSLWEYPTLEYIKCIMILVLYSQALDRKSTIKRNTSEWRYSQISLIYNGCLQKISVYVIQKLYSIYIYIYISFSCIVSFRWYLIKENIRKLRGNQENIWHNYFVANLCKGCQYIPVNIQFDNFTVWSLL